ncbi:MAG: hypothetical protein ACM3MF_01845 [Anaerolineae bacterium]
MRCRLRVLRRPDRVFVDIDREASMPRTGSLLSALLALSILNIALAGVIAVRYGYGPQSSLEAAGACVVLLIAAGLLWFYRRRASRGAFGPGFQRLLEAGALLGLMWVIEIAINNILAPPLPARDIIDNLFWALIALILFGLSIFYAYRANSVSRGLQAGIWAGSISGLIACSAALILVVFGMQLLLNDPLNVAEWSSDRLVTSAPSMASYFAFETLAGALSHLVLLGLIMGALLGGIGGGVGKVLHALHPARGKDQGELMPWT